MDPWKDIETGRNVPKVVNAVIEIPMGSRNKYELDKKTGLIKLDRVVYSSVSYPGDYGFIPQTLWDDGDPLDVLVITRFPSHPLVLMEVRPIGVMKIIDDSERDDKIIAVPLGDPFFEKINDVKELQPHILEEIKNFFEIYKQLQNKVVKVEKLLNRKEAYKSIERAVKLFKKKFEKKK
ncbi:MAG: inorganic pyrophosphatase [Candidatus Woesearchaeota archaeon]|nr:inorganic pyrophosphatase [Candidatus Woesearchaeota archaeon]MDN5327623.1 inorganic pyrophosphatase [Candidatus Woesearchaeota archaeon]